jgi:urea transport system substrate-binding protein
MLQLTRRAALAGILAGTVLAGAPAFAQDTIKIGVLHSLSGTMAISETTLKDTVLMLVNDLNKKGAAFTFFGASVFPTTRLQPSHQDS